MRIVADENIAWIEAFFKDMGDLTCVSGRQLCAEQVQEADILLVRSVTSVNQSLLAKSRVRFVGSATIGHDHLDREWLQQQQITAVTAPGCNAQSVVEYVISALLHSSVQQSWDWTTRVFGIVGLGNVGYRLASTLKRLGLQVIGCDPWQQRDDITQVSLPELLATADVISLHTPLVKTGPYPTYHLFSTQELAALRPNTILVNSGRGAVIDNQALLAYLSQPKHHLAAVILDVWENEPLPNKKLLALVNIATPHIAGYSVEGKSMGTAMIYQQLCQFLQKSPHKELKDFLSPVTTPLSLVETGNDWHDLWQLMQQIYPITRDDQALRGTLVLPDTERALAFDQLRKHYWQRRELAAYSVTQPITASLKEKMQALGFLV